MKMLAREYTEEMRARYIIWSADRGLKGFGHPIPPPPRRKVPGYIYLESISFGQTVGFWEHRYTALKKNYISKTEYLNCIEKALDLQ